MGREELIDGAYGMEGENGGCTESATSPRVPPFGNRRDNQARWKGAKKFRALASVNHLNDAVVSTTLNSTTFDECLEVGN
jgi:hypothetical protein